MKTFISSVAITCLAVSAAFAAPDSAAMETREKQAWQTFKDKDAAAFQKVVDKDIRCVYDGGVMMMADELASMKSADTKSFAISDFKIFSDEKDVIVATYTVKIDGTAEGQDISGTYNAGTVWKEENGQWMAIFHTHVKQAPK